MAASKQGDGAKRLPWQAQAPLLGSVLAALLLPLGALGTRFGLWSFEYGLLLVASGALLALIVLLGSLLVLFTRWRSAVSGERALVLGAMALSLGIAVLMGVQLEQGRSVPAIHHVTTDPQDPPAFDVVEALRGEDANPLDYDAEALAPLQSEAYPWLQPMRVTLAPRESFERARTVLESMGLEIVNADAEAGRIEAVATTFWFGFEDDLVVRIRPDNEGSVVDLRSVSRVGLSDLGANAQRIAEFQYRFDQR